MSGLDGGGIEQADDEVVGLGARGRGLGPKALES
jgi:hypothetical protein